MPSREGRRPIGQQKDQKNKEIRDALFPDCPIRNVLARVGDKWSLLVLYNLQHREPVRFKELQRQIPDISQKSLTQTLRTLEEDGFVHREVFAEVPPRVEYNLTPRAYSFLPLVENMIRWAKENMEDIIADRERNV
ncbi:MAG: helix-turn-helix transcriptional regulator [Prevotella sp.]|nr:helix-turn-helix transcriptional regulator [Prevotella sp.]